MARHKKKTPEAKQPPKKKSSSILRRKPATRSGDDVDVIYNRWNHSSKAGKMLEKGLATGEIDANLTPMQVYESNKECQKHPKASFRAAFARLRSKLGLFLRNKEDEDDANADTALAWQNRGPVAFSEDKDDDAEDPQDIDDGESYVQNNSMVGAVAEVFPAHLRSARSDNSTIDTSVMKPAHSISKPKDIPIVSPKKTHQTTSSVSGSSASKGMIAFQPNYSISHWTNHVTPMLTVAILLPSGVSSREASTVSILPSLKELELMIRWPALMSDVNRLHAFKMRPSDSLASETDSKLIGFHHFLNNHRTKDTDPICARTVIKLPFQVQKMLKDFKRLSDGETSANVTCVDLMGVTDSDHKDMDQDNVCVIH